jgi:hypothetical protein
MSDNLAKFRKLSWFERRLLLESLLLLPASELALRFVPLRNLRLVNDRPRPFRREPVDRARAERIAHMVAAAAEYGPYHATCLPQSFVLQFLLRRDGMRGEMRYGVKKIDGVMAAHCWIEIDGAPLIDSPQVHRHFAVLQPQARNDHDAA